jgi:hypothetical protein
LTKTAHLYIQQSTLRQVFENTENTQRQYALRQRAIVLGWPAEHIEVIDCDQGQSGASTAERREHSRATGNIARSFLSAPEKVVRIVSVRREPRLSSQPANLKPEIQGWPC